MAFVRATDLRREYNAQRKREREAQREQVKRNRELAKKGLISGPPRLTILEAKTLSQTEAATLLDCVIGQWQSEKTQSQD
jgi:hypothetical protein